MNYTKNWGKSVERYKAFWHVETVVLIQRKDT